MAADLGADVRQMALALRPFPAAVYPGALASHVDTAALSIPRGNGKSWLAAHLLTRCLTPGDVLNVPGMEYLLEWLGVYSIEPTKKTRLFIPGRLPGITRVLWKTPRRGAERQSLTAGREHQANVRPEQLFDEAQLRGRDT